MIGGDSRIRARPRRGALGALVAVVVGGFVSLASLAGCGSEMDRAVDDYVAARESRGATFCACFYELIGYDEEATCTEAYKFSSTEIGCLKGIFEDREDPGEHDRFSSKPAIECLATVEREYERCLNALKCEDLEGLDECISDYNDAIVECPRLSEDDTEDFDNCLLL